METVREIRSAVQEMYASDQAVVSPQSEQEVLELLVPTVSILLRPQCTI